MKNKFIKIKKLEFYNDGILDFKFLSYIYVWKSML